VGAKDRHDAPLTRSQERQRIERAFADPQWPGAGLQCGGVEVPLGTREMVMAFGLGDLLSRAHCAAVQIYQAPLRRGVGKDHATAAPVAGCMRPGARSRRAHAALLRERQRHAALLQGGGDAAAGQGGLEGGELRRQGGPRRSGFARCRWVCGWLARDCRRSWALALCPLRASRRPLEGCLALLFLTPLRMRRFEVAPGAAGKADEAATVQLYA
jgi:hypothetical protein